MIASWLFIQKSKCRRHICFLNRWKLNSYCSLFSLWLSLVVWIDMCKYRMFNVGPWYQHIYQPLGFVAWCCHYIFLVYHASHKTIQPFDISLKICRTRSCSMHKIICLQGTRCSHLCNQGKTTPLHYFISEYRLVWYPIQQLRISTLNVVANILLAESCK